jgi:hypothetical protein
MGIGARPGPDDPTLQTGPRRRQGTRAAAAGSTTKLAARQHTVLNCRIRGEEGPTPYGALAAAGFAVLRPADGRGWTAQQGRFSLDQLIYNYVVCL